MHRNTRDILEAVQNGGMSVDEALLALKTEPFEDLGFAKIDHHRAIRQGVPEVIFGAGKTAEQIAEITRHMRDKGQERVLITRVDTEKAKEAAKLLGGDGAASGGGQKDVSGWIDLGGLLYHETAKLALSGEVPEADGDGTIVVACGGTSDLPVSEEAAVTAEVLGNRVVRLYDVGVAGLHRLLSHSEEVMTASVVIAVAGMEGALASVIGGLVDCPVIAVPTSVGYGASFGGLSALLSMLNSCASGVGVVNIDNGFGAAYLAGMINHRRP